MKQGFMLTHVQCQNCKFTATVNPNFIDTLNAVRLAASQLHKDSGVICGQPVIFLTYVNAMVSNSAIPDQQIITRPNGNGGG